MIANHLAQKTVRKIVDKHRDTATTASILNISDIS